MSHYLIPRLAVQDAAAIFNEHQQALASGALPSALANPHDPRTHVNDTGGRAPAPRVLTEWRERLLEVMSGVATKSPHGSPQLHSASLGRAIGQCISPLASDAGHDGTWSYLSLCLVPEIVHARWPADNGDIPMDRWVGAQLGRDRNYLKSAWRRWSIFGDLTFEGRPLLGEDEYGALLERSSLARTPRVLVSAAKKVLAFDSPGGRSHFTRELMKRVTWQTGARLLDLLSDQELEEIIEEAAMAVAHNLEAQTPRRALTG